VGPVAACLPAFPLGPWRRAVAHWQAPTLRPQAAKAPRGATAQPVTCIRAVNLVSHWRGSLSSCNLSLQFI